jgi:hypothetical protein
LKDFHVAPAGDSTFERRLAEEYVGDYLLDLRPRSDAIGPPEWLTTEQQARHIGAVLSSVDARVETEPIIPVERYDGIAFIRCTTAARANRLVHKRELEGVVELA